MSGREADPRAWAEKAEHDLLAVRSLAAGASVPWDIVVFHAQQGAEKYLKGLGTSPRCSCRSKRIAEG